MTYCCTSVPAAPPFLHLGVWERLQQSPMNDDLEQDRVFGSRKPTLELKKHGAYHLHSTLQYIISFMFISRSTLTTSLWT